MKQFEWLYWLCGAFLILFYWVNIEGIELSDQYLYAKNAYAIGNGTFELTPSVFSNRFAVFVPLSLFVKTLGVHPLSVTIWSLLCFLFLLGSSWLFYRSFFKEGDIVLIALLILNPLLIKHAANTLPDLVMLTFATSSFYVLIYQRVKGFSKPGLWGVMALLLIFISFLAKETVVYLFPLFFYFFIVDIVKKKNIKFWVALSGATVICFGLFLWLYYSHTGNPLYRFSGIESEHNVSEVWSYYGKGTEVIIGRLSYDTIVFLMSHYYMGWLLVPGMIFFLFKKEKTEIYKQLKIVLFYILFILWFASTSTKGYNPIPLIPRMWILVFPFLSIGASLFITSYAGLKGKKWVLLILGGSIVISVFNYLLQSDSRLLFSTFVFIGLLGYCFFYQIKWLRTGALASIILLFMALQGQNAIANVLKKTEYAVESTIFEDLSQSESSVAIITDPKMNRMHDIYFGFNKVNNLEFVDWRKIERDELKRYEEKYILFNKRRVEEIAGRYNKNIPKWVLDSVGSKASNDKKVILVEFK